MSDRPEWFAPKRYGLGAGFPIVWPGWVLLFMFLVLILAASLLLNKSALALGVVVGMLTFVLLVIAARTTKGGWRWRWGEKE